MFSHITQVSEFDSAPVLNVKVAIVDGTSLPVYTAAVHDACSHHCLVLISGTGIVEHGHWQT